MLIDVNTLVKQPDPEKLNWLSFEQASTTAPGGKTYIGDGRFVDADGNSLDPESQMSDIDQEIAKLEARKHQLEAQKSGLKPEKVEPVKPVTPPVVK